MTNIVNLILVKQQSEEKKKANENKKICHVKLNYYLLKYSIVLFEFIDFLSQTQSGSWFLDVLMVIKRAGGPWGEALKSHATNDVELLANKTCHNLRSKTCSNS